MHEIAAQSCKFNEVDLAKYDIPEWTNLNK